MCTDQSDQPRFNTIEYDEIEKLVQGFFIQTESSENAINAHLHATFHSLIDHLTRTSQLEHLILEISSVLFSADDTQIESVIQSVLSEVGVFLLVDRVYIFEFNEEAATMNNTYEWCNKGIRPEIENLQNLPISMFPMWMNQLNQNKMILIPDVASLPSDWQAERDILEAQSIESIMVLPLRARKKLIGFIGFDSINRGMQWTEESSKLLNFLARNIGAILHVNRTRSNMINAIQIANQVAQTAELANQEKANYLSNLSHEIRSPMNAVMGMAGILADTNLTSLQRRYVEIIQENSRAIIQTIDNILDLSGIETGKLEVNSTVFSIIEVVRNSADIFTHKLADKQLSLTMSIDPDTPVFLIGDPSRISQIITNLFSAIANSSKKGLIHFETKVEHHSEEICHMIFDISYPGDQNEDIGVIHLHEPYWHSSTSIRADQHRSGLEMAISKNLAELLGGSLAVRSEKSGVRSFNLHLSFPVDRNKGQGEPHNPHAIKSPLLIISRDSQELVYLRKIFDLWQVETYTASTGPEIHQMLRDTRVNDITYEYCLINLNPADEADMEMIQLLGSHESVARHIVLFADLIASGIGNPGRLPVFLDGIIPKPIQAVSLYRDLLVFSKGGNNPDPVEKDGQKQILRSTKVLVAEDIEINQEIIRIMLNRIGVDCDLVSDGIAAEEKARQNDYDAILMDIQMPVMDGLEATRQIRAQASDARQHIPIIALTAHSLREEQIRCFAAGMDDHVKKPIEADQLYQVLAKWMPHKIKDSSGLIRARRSGKGASSEKIQTAGNVFDPISGLERFYLNKPVYQKILSSYSRQYRDFSDHLQQLATVDGQNELLSQLHQLKAASGSIGSEPVMKQAAKLERLIKDGSSVVDETVQYQIEILRMMHNKLIREVDQYLNSSYVSDDHVQRMTDGDALTLTQAIDRLETSLSDFNPFHGKEIIRDLTNKKWPEPISDSIDRIRGGLESYRYDAIRSAIGDLRHLIESQTQSITKIEIQDA